MIVNKTLAVIVSFVLFGLLLIYVMALTRNEAPPISPYSNSSKAASLLRIDGVAIAPVEEALTFARFRDGTDMRLMRVDRYEKGSVFGTDITSLQKHGEADPIALWQQSDYSTIATAEGPSVSIEATLLQVPFSSNSKQIAMGGTYPAHANETKIPKPFVFPKLQPAHQWNMQVPARSYLLDYEIELGFVALEPLSKENKSKHFGLILASDYTDRDRLTRDLKINDVSSGLAFAPAKSIVPAMPVGALFVIPQDLQKFCNKLELRLDVNDRPRQIAMPKDLVWDIDQMVDAALARKTVAYPMGHGSVSLPIADEMISERTILLSGTTDGVVFRPPSARQMYIGVVQWLGSLRWNMPSAIFERSIIEAHANGYYLQPGDRVIMRSDYLGLIVNEIVP